MKQLITSILVFGLSLFGLSQETYSDSLIFSKYGYLPYRTISNSNLDTTLSTIKWMESTDSILFSNSGPLVDSVNAEFIFQGNNHFQVCYITSKEKSENDIWLSLAREIINGKWMVIDNKIFVNFSDEDRKIRFQLLLKGDSAVFIKK